MEVKPFKIEIQTLCIPNVVLCKANKLRTTVRLVSSKENYFINNESKLNMLNLIILHVGLHVEFIKHNPNFNTCSCLASILVAPNLPIDVNLQMLNLSNEWKRHNSKFS